MGCDRRVVKSLIRWASASSDNYDALVAALDEAIVAQLAGDDRVLSASADGASFTKVTNSMSLNDQIACWELALDIIDNYDGIMPSTKAYVRIF